MMGNMNNQLVRRPVVKHPWRLHKWRDVNGIVDSWGTIRQCQKCWEVVVINQLTMEAWRGSHEMLRYEGMMH